MNHEEAVERLRAAGLRTHDLGVEHGIMGGSFVDRSSGMGMVQNCYLLRPNPDGNYETFVEPLDPQRSNLPLEEGVDLIIKSISPGEDIEAEVKPVVPGRPVYY